MNPFLSPFANQIELLNELTTLVLTYGHLHFTDYMPEPESRRIVGFLYIIVILLNFGVHLIILISDTCIKGKFVFRRCYFWCKLKWWRLKIWWSYRKNIKVTNGQAQKGVRNGLERKSARNRQVISLDKSDIEHSISQSELSFNSALEMVQALKMSEGLGITDPSKKIKLVPTAVNFNMCEILSDGVLP